MTEQLTNEQRKNIATTYNILMGVSRYERNILTKLRQFSHGRFIIQIIDGVPYRFLSEISELVTMEGGE